MQLRVRWPVPGPTKWRHRTSVLLALLSGKQRLPLNREPAPAALHSRNPDDGNSARKPRWAFLQLWDHSLPRDGSTREALGAAAQPALELRNRPEGQNRVDARKLRSQFDTP